MKNTYTALLGIFVAYSAFVGVTSPRPQEPSTPTGKPAEAQNNTRTKLAGPASSVVENFPTISAGRCSLDFDPPNPLGPCGGCTKLCPAKPFLDQIAAQFPSTQAPATSTRDGKVPLAGRWNIPVGSQNALRFVVALVPDPIHTHSALLFDRFIEQVQSAAQANGFLFSRSWMPWDNSSHSESSDFTVRGAQEEYAEDVESLPGLLLFGGKSTTLIVLVVGETPTGGIHVQQFKNALSIRTAMLAGNAGSEADTLRILGPSFSGSLPSLSNALPDAAKDAKQIVIRSGTINSAAAVDDFCAGTSRSPIPGCAGAVPGTNPPSFFDFETLQYSDRAQEYFLARFFCDRHEEHSHVAILSEDETRFGNQEAIGEEPVGDGDATRCKTCESPAPKPAIPFVRLYFPRGIAQLRDAYQQNVKRQQTSDTGKSTPEPSGLPLSLGVTGNDEDSVPTYAPLQSPLSEDTIMEALVSKLRVHHAKVVIIRASDPLDTVFLARYLRQNYSQARLITVGADLLMIHEFYDPKFHGILAVATYPLVTGAEFPTLNSAGVSVNSVQRLFPDSYAAGVFNAAVSVIPTQSGDGESAAQGVAQCLPPRKYTQFGLPSYLSPNKHDRFNQFRPHLWLTAIGRDGYRPVEILDDVPGICSGDLAALTMDVRSVDAKTPRSSSYSVHMSLGWMIFWIPSLLVTLFFAFMLAWPGLFKESEALARFAAVQESPRNMPLFTVGMFILLIQSTLALPAIYWGNRFGLSELKPLAFCCGWIESLFNLRDDAREMLNGFPVVAVAYVLSAASLGLSFYWGFRKRKAYTLAKVGVCVCGIAIIVFLTLSAVYWSRPLSSNFGSFLFRYLDVGSGVSPALPILFLFGAWGWWAWQSFTGAAIVEDKEMSLPSQSTLANAQNLSSIDRLRTAALGAQSDGWPWQSFAIIARGRTFYIGFTGFLVILALMRPSEIAEAFDGWLFKWTYWILLYSCLFLVTMLAAQIVMLWFQFRGLLNAIEALPLRRGFSEVKSLTWKPLWKLAGNGLQEFLQLLRRELNALERIRSRGLNEPEFNADVSSALESSDDLATIFTASLDHSEDGYADPAVRGLFKQLQFNVAQAATQALLYAAPRWRGELQVSKTEPCLASDEKDTDKKPNYEPPSKDPALRDVEHFLCLFYLGVILVPLRRLQTLILALAGVFVFVLLSYSSYPFESRESFHAMLICIFFGISAVVGVVYGQMFSNPLLSRITNTTPGELGLDFWIRLGSFVFIPLLSLLSVQFPEINSFLFSWLQPAMQSIK